MKTKKRTTAIDIESWREAEPVRAIVIASKYNEAIENAAEALLHNRQTCYEGYREAACVYGWLLGSASDETDDNIQSWLRKLEREAARHDL